MIPELSLNGEVFRQGSPMALGEEIDLSYQQSGPLATYAPYQYRVIAGSYLNIPLVAQSVDPDALIELQAKIEQTRAILESEDQNLIRQLSREDLLGDLFYAGGLGYFAQYNGLTQIAALQSKSAHKLEVGYGSYGYEPNVATFFGIPQGIETGGAAFNIRVGRIVESFDGDQQAENSLRFQAGLISSVLEHAVPEQMFSDPDNPTDGVSAVKALQLAAQQGQKIYQIDSDNLYTALGDVSIGLEIENEIRQAVLNGKIAITHQSNIQVPGWSGAGYLILDPDLMDGSYKISGGGNGGELQVDDRFLYVSAAALGFDDGRVGSVLSQLSSPPANSGYLKYLEKWGRLSAYVGVLALVVAFAGISTNGDLGNWQKLGQFSTAILGFIATMKVVTIIPALIPLGPLGIAIIAALLATVISLAIAEINAVLNFAMRWKKLRIEYV